MITNRSLKLTKNYLSKLQRVECPDTTFISDRFPIVMKKAAGMWIRDVDDNRYLDFSACFGVLALGHRSKVTLQAIRKQAAQIIHAMGDVHPSVSRIHLLELLAQVSPFQNSKALLGQSGGDAIESAMKTAMLATKRSCFMSFAGGYHGVQFAPLILSDRVEFTAGFEAWLNGKSVTLPFPYFKENFVNNHESVTEDFFLKNHNLYNPTVVLQQLEDLLRSKKFAALVVEPIQGRGGKRSFTPDFMKTCQALCKKYGTLLIFDEIYTGFGRTGTLFACEHYGVVPDMMCVGKALGGGLPISACMGDILDVWAKSQGEAKHTQTFLGHPLACYVAYKTILTIQKQLPAFQAELIKIDQEFTKFEKTMHATGLFQKFPYFLVGKGFMRGIWFYKQKNNLCVSLMQELLERGFIVLPEGKKADVLSLTPPLIAKATHYKKILASVINILKSRD